MSSGRKQTTAPPAVDRGKHRYPYALVWTPIHPLSWVAPYVGHCGVCDAEGRVIDFAGPYHVGQNNMLFGWPTRCVRLDAWRSGADKWDPKLYELVYRFERQSYDFLAWNCHSLVAAMLNASEEPRDWLARALGGWTVVGVACHFFFRSRHLGLLGWVQTWGGHALIWCLVATESVRQRSLSPLSLWVLLQLGMAAFFAGWFGFLALLRLDSQYGRTRPRSLPPSPAQHPNEISPSHPSDLKRSQQIPTAYTLADDDAPNSPALSRIDSDEHVPMRVDSFGDIVEDMRVQSYGDIVEAATGRSNRDR